MTDVTTTIYISSGRKNAQYTLRRMRTGGGHHSDQYIRNLGRHPLAAEAKARAWYDKVWADQPGAIFAGFADFDLDDYGAAQPWEREQHELMDQGLVPFGKNKGTPIADLSDNQIMWWATENGNTDPARKFVQICAQIDEGLGLSAKRDQARQEFLDKYKATANVPVTNDRVTVTGEVVGKKWAEGYAFNTQVLKLVILSDDGYKVYGTCPSSLDEIERGDRVQFDAKIQPSDDDPRFGFYSRPTKAKKVK